MKEKKLENKVNLLLFTVIVILIFVGVWNSWKTERTKIVTPQTKFLSNKVYLTPEQILRYA